jgi:hypothetical protein
VSLGRRDGTSRRQRPTTGAARRRFRGAYRVRNRGYVFSTKRRFQPASDRFAAIVLLANAEHPSVYLVPSTEWRSASPPLKDRENLGKKSEPEFGISLARSSLPALERYRWDEESAKNLFR